MCYEGTDAMDTKGFFSAQTVIRAPPFACGSFLSALRVICIYYYLNLLQCLRFLFCFSRSFICVIVALAALELAL